MVKIHYIYVQDMEELAANFNAEPEMAYHEAVGSNNVAEAIYAYTGTLERTKSSPTDEEFQGGCVALQ